MDIVVILLILGLYAVTQWLVRLLAGLGGVE